MRVLIPLILLSMALLSRASGTERSEIPENLQWNLAEIYPSAQAAADARDAFSQRLPELARYQGKLGESSDTLLAALELWMDLDRTINRIYAFASARSDEDTRNSENLALKQSVEQVWVQYGAASSFLRPEIISLDPVQVKAWVAAEPRLQPYQTFLDDILRRKPHTRSQAEEKIIAQADNMSGAGDSTFSIFTNADLPYPEVTLSTGEKVRMDAAAYTKHRASAVRADRMTVFQAFWGKHQEFRRTLATTLYSQVKAHMFTKEARNFPSCLAASLFGFNIPETVYRQLIADVHTNLPTLHRYLKLRQRILGVDQLRYEDIYPSLVDEADLTYTPEQAKGLVLAAFEPLGPAYTDVLRKGFESRWIDWMPSTGKRSGAYSMGVFDVHPYQLLNYMGQYDDVSTLAHELGHAMHSYLSSKHQPYVTHDYSLFVAEVASTFNENLLFHRMMSEAKDDQVRLFLLGSYLDLIRGTLFRQTLFAEFELLIHEMAERGEPLTGDALNALYLKLLREYMGHDQQVCVIDDLYGVEWAYIPHFYYNFYVYQYATSLTASITLAQKVRAETSAQPASTAARDAYLKLLSAGSSKYPIELLRDAGVDMTTPVPFSTAMAEMNRIMDEIDVILARRQK